MACWTAKTDDSLPSQVLLDVGAGLSLHLLAAAARGHRAIAVELSPPSLRALNASIAVNGFGDSIVVHQVGCCWLVSMVPSLPGAQ